MSLLCCVSSPALSHTVSCLVFTANLSIKGKNALLLQLPVSLHPQRRTLHLGFLHLIHLIILLCIDLLHPMHPKQDLRAQLVMSPESIFFKFSSTTETIKLFMLMLFIMLFMKTLKYYSSSWCAGRTPF